MKTIKKKQPLKIYLSGPITNDPNFVDHFQEHAKKLRDKGYIVLDPTVWARESVKLEYEEYMKLDLAMLEICDAIYMLPGWSNSRGALIEQQRAIELEMVVYYSN